MSDGPFRNTKLSSRWKQYGQKLVSDAVTSGERTMQACHSMIGDVDMLAFTRLYDELKVHTQRPQMDLDPAAAIVAIFDNHPGFILADVLKRHLVANLGDSISPEKALDQAIDSTTKEWIRTIKNRLDEDCIRARDCGDMNHADYRKGIERNHESFSAVKPSDLCGALISGNKRAFDQAVQKKSGIDEGPGE